MMDNRRRQNTFRSLEAYQQGKELVKIVYALLKKFPKEEQFALCDQLRRAVISITSNIAEGDGRNSVKENMHFLDISYGSLMEVLSQMDVARDLSYISDQDFTLIENKVFDCARLIGGYRGYLDGLLRKGRSAGTEDGLQ